MLKLQQACKYGCCSSNYNRKMKGLRRNRDAMKIFAGIIFLPFCIYPVLC